MISAIQTGLTPWAGRRFCRPALLQLCPAVAFAGANLGRRPIEPSVKGAYSVPGESQDSLSLSHFAETVLNSARERLSPTDRGHALLQSETVLLAARAHAPAVRDHAPAVRGCVPSQSGNVLPTARGHVPRCPRPCPSLPEAILPAARGYVPRCLGLCPPLPGAMSTAAWGYVPRCLGLCPPLPGTVPPTMAVHFWKLGVRAAKSTVCQTVGGR